MHNSVNLSHHFLLAMPGLMDSNFHHTLTYICEHNEHGAMGIVINRPLGIDMQEVLEQMEIAPSGLIGVESQIYYGGPVDPERGFVLHQPVGSWDASLQTSDDIAVTTSRDILQAIAAGRGPYKALTALGYAGWGSGQLEHELTQNTWLSCPADSRVLFDTPAEQRLEAAAALMGIDLRLLSSEAGHS